MRILKELVFSRVKAYNLVQTETMERYYQTKLLSVAHSRLDRFISMRYQGLNAKAYEKGMITQVSNTIYTVQSNTECGVTYNIDMDIGTCTCPAGRDGSPCSHQAAVALHYRCNTVNCIMTTPQGKMLLAFIAYGENAVSDLAFYQAVGSSQEPIQSTSLESMQIHGIDECQVPKEPPQSSPGQQGEDQSDRADDRALCARIDSMAQCIKKRLVEDSAFKQSVVKKFLATFETLSAKHTNSHLTSAFHKFGWCFGGYIS